MSDVYLYLNISRHIFKFRQTYDMFLGTKGVVVDNIMITSRWHTSGQVAYNISTRKAVNEVTTT
jgi:hypothetical protein